MLILTHKGVLLMKNEIVRILKIEINNLKNVKNGIITFKNFSYVKENHLLDDGDVLGVYGQNGSGKTTLVDAINIFKEIVSGKQLSENVCRLISNDETFGLVEIMFYICSNGKKYIATYSAKLSKAETKESKESVYLSKEKITYSTLSNNKWKRTITLMDYDYSNQDIIKPAYRLSELTNNSKDAFLKLNVAKELSKKSSTSFLFSKETKDLLYDTYNDSDDIIIITSSILNFANLNLFVITNENLGYINTSILFPFSFRFEENNSVFTGNIAIKLFDSFTVPVKVYKLLSKIIQQINVVLGTIIPDLQLQIHDYGDQLMEDGQEGKRIELLSISNGRKIPLTNESDGIKKIISILSAIIAMYNNSYITVVIDELDSGIFEFLLGEILEVLDKNTKGQLIFTSHNLRPLEKMSKYSVIFTTTNPTKRYIRLKNVNATNNLRDFYLRSISLGGQQENIYNETNTYEIQYALKTAGRIGDEN